VDRAAALVVALCNKSQVMQTGTNRSRRVTASAVPPRVIRFRDASRYVGMDRYRFNSEVRPFLTEIPIGTQGIGFDRLELDAWVDEYFARNGRPARKGEKPWDASEYPASSCEVGIGTSTNGSAGASLPEH
jgi:hypothetical protein